jgi:hypothetical protein
MSSPKPRGHAHAATRFTCLERSVRRGHGTPALLVLLLLIPLLCGCNGAASQNTSLPGWQHAVEAYVHDIGKDDPAALGEVQLAGGRLGFAVLGNPVPTESQDAVGVLLAHRPIAGKPAFIYLVGVVNKQEVRDIRLALLTFEDGKPRWSLSPANSAALDAYRKHRDAVWRHQFPGRKDPPADALNFPAASDVFSLSSDAQRITVAHAASGASWTLTVGEQHG